MKTLLVLFLFMTSVHAAPVLNQNMAAEETFVTIWPDHVDPNHFYFAPNFMKIASDKDNGLKFHFTQYRTGTCGRVFRKKCQYKALITSLMIAGYEEEQLLQAMAGIRKIVPGARFSAIPFLSSKVDFSETLNDFIEQHDCSPRAGQAADEVPCSITLNQLGILNLMPFLNSGRIISFKFIYKIAGVIEGPNKEYTAREIDYGLTVNLGGSELIKNPELDSDFIWDE